MNFRIFAGNPVVVSMLLVLVCIWMHPVAETGSGGREPEEFLRDFIRDYAENDKLPAGRVVFGVRISGEGGGEWTVTIDGDSAGKVVLTPGFPEEPTFYLVTDPGTLEKIHAGDMNALTAAGRARMSDPTPLDFGFMEGFEPSPEFLSDVMLPLGFHFFNRGKPEIVYFGEEYSRNVHGGNAVIFYYQQGLRTGWYQVRPGMMINENLDDAVNPFPTLFIITRGEGRGRLGEKEMGLREGMTIYVPAGMVHQFWAEEEPGMEFVIIMFGEGA